MRRQIEEAPMAKRPGLWDNIRAKRKRIEQGSGERMRSPGEKGAPTDEALERSARKNYRNGGCVMAGRGGRYKGMM
jgi:hypothetical protein